MADRVGARHRPGVRRARWPDRGPGDADVVLAGAIGRGDPGALAEAYDRHGTCVYHFALRRCGPALAEQVTRDVFLALWRSPWDFPTSDGSLRGPLLVRAHLRVTDLVQEDVSWGAGPTAAAGPGAVEVLSHLSAAEHIAIALVHVGGLTYEQVAHLVGRPRLAVAADLRSGLNRLASG